MLIVDDEPVIADGLFDVFSKFEVQLDLSKAYSGYEALDILKRTRVDIVLTDIRMPGMDGIQLMEHISQEWPHCKIIFLTGYNDFDYVYKAIQKPGVSYILKTEGYRKIKDIVLEAIAKLDHDLLMEDLVEQSQTRLHTLETLLQGEYMRYLLKESRDAEAMRADFDKLNIPLDPEQPIIAVLGVLQLPSKRDSYVNRQEAALTVKLLAEPFLKEKVKHVSVLDRYQDVLWFIQPKKETMERVDPAIRNLAGIFELIERACTDSLQVALAFTLTEQMVDWANIGHAYDKLRQLQSVRVGDGTHMVHIASVKESVASDMQHAIRLRTTTEQTNMLTIHLESGREEEFFESLETIIQDIDNDSPLSHAMECYYSIALVMLAQLNRLNITDKVNIKKLTSFDEHTSWSAGFAFLKQTAELLFHHRRTGEQNRAAQIVAQLRTFIEEHLSEDLSLVRLAEYTHFNPSYLSRLFKQESGVNLSEYIEERRVKKAQELLKQPELKIAEIGAMVGYVSPHSFARFFKKMTGLAPQEYRER